MSIISDNHMQQLIRKGVAIECGIFFKREIIFCEEYNCYNETGDVVIIIKTASIGGIIFYNININQYKDIWTTCENVVKEILSWNIYRM